MAKYYACEVILSIFCCFVKCRPTSSKLRDLTIVRDEMDLIDEYTLVSVENIDTMTAYGAAYHGYWVEVSSDPGFCTRGTTKLNNTDALAGHHPAQPPVRRQG
jgi:hypothetical protein